MSTNTPEKSPYFEVRSAGVLLHPTSLPCSESCWGDAQEKAFGTLGRDAYRFLDLIAAAGLKVWQMLPTGPTQADMSPYQSISAHAGNAELISLDWLVEQGWVAAKDIVLREKTATGVRGARRQCAQSFIDFIDREEGASTQNEYQEFCRQQAYWLDDFVLFCAIRDHHQNSSWVEWPESLRKRDLTSLEKIKIELSADINVYMFEQFAFFSQWQALRRYAKDRGIWLFGDMPIFVGHDSADVWSQQHYFQLDESGHPLTVAGVPPDYFSETGQHWGNPHYAWKVMEADGFQWWLARLRTQLALFDFIRIDHFRGFESYWEIPGDKHDARLGKWVKAPGEALLEACFEAFPDLPLVAENLGVITDEVEDLRHKFYLPGMLVLQFAFDGNSQNPHLPHNHRPSDVIYTGTHDNDTTLGWWENLAPQNRKQFQAYHFDSQEPMPWLLIQAALASVGRMAIIPMQDFMELDGRHRMNMPGTTDKNWAWTFTWDQVDPHLAEHIRPLLEIYHRLT